MKTAMYIPKICKVCGKAFDRERIMETFCSAACSRAARRVSDVKYRAKLRRRLWAHKESLGCGQCGYNKHGAALDWHHPDSNKEQRLTVRNYFTPVGRKERDKCILLCSNCHRVVHADG